MTKGRKFANIQGLKIYHFTSMSSRNFWLSKELILSVAFVLLITVPVVVFGGSKVIYVDKDGHGDEDGSNDHPYQTIERALKHAEDGTEVRIKSGTYKENVTIPEGVKMVGDSEDSKKVVIKSDDKDHPVVVMKHGTELSYVTLKGGYYGVRVKSDASAHLYEVEIKDSKQDGIHIDRAPVKKKFRVLLDSVSIKGSGRSGIYAEKRFIVVVNSSITESNNDGLDLAAGTRSWLENDNFNSNEGSGAKLVMDGSEIWTRKNSFRNNKREGVEINSYGAAGKMGFNKAIFAANGRYGVAKVSRTTSGLQGFTSLFFGDKNNAGKFERNHFGDISSTTPLF